MVTTVLEQHARASRIAAQCVGQLWPLVVKHEGPQPSDLTPVHIPEVFTPPQLEEWALPIGDDRTTTQPVALANDFVFERPETPDELLRAYKDAARTRVYECMSVNTGGWFSLATLQLSRLARCAAIASVYQSTAGDKTLGVHKDLWYGVIVQMHGAKTWHFKRQRHGADFAVMTIRQGDVLLLPEGIWHDVETPEESVHLLFAIDTNNPIAPLN